MLLRFPIKDVTIKVTKHKSKVNLPLYTDEWNEINQNEFTLDVEDVAWFYASAGNYIEVSPYGIFKKQALELYLNSTVYAAILHQRKILALHGSCFNYQYNNIMICGDSGAGKSSLTVAFCLNGGTFITDDISPVTFTSDKPYILSLSDTIKLWEDSLAQLNIKKEGLVKILDDADKFYFPVKKEATGTFLLSLLFVLEVTDKAVVEFEEIKGVEKLNLLRSQIYRLEMLKGMPENELLIFHQLADISNNVKIIRVKRPIDISINRLMNLLKNYIN